MRAGNIGMRAKAAFENIAAYFAENWVKRVNGNAALIAL